MFFREKKLGERDPATLSIEMLSILQASLTAKLILVNKELLGRWQNIASLSDGVPDTESERMVLVEGVKWLQGFNLVLEHALAKIAGKLPKR